MANPPDLPFGLGGFDVGEMLRMLRGEGPLNLEIARQMAVWVASGGPGAIDGLEAGENPALAPLAAMRAPADEDPVPGDEQAALGELARTAQIHVREATGLGGGVALDARVATRSEWARSSLDGLGPVLTTLAERMGAATSASPDPFAALDDPPAAPGTGDVDLSALMAAIGPILLGVQAGFMVGHLAARTLGRYEMPLPLESQPAVEFVAPNIAAFEGDWELPGEELRFYVALHETVHAGLRGVPWVQQRLLALAREYVAAFDVDPSVVEERLGSFDLGDPSSLQSALGDPAEFLDAMRAPAQRQVHERLRTFVALLQGYTDATLAELGGGLLSSFDRIREACHRHRVERGDAARFLETLLGFDVGRDEYEAAGAFCAGVAERAGREGLRRLWDDESMVPTAPELEAPGLWLARIDLHDGA